MCPSYSHMCMYDVCVCVCKITKHACGIQMLPEDDEQVNEYVHTFIYLQPL